jgi:hypothetical protein
MRKQISQWGLNLISRECLSINMLSLTPRQAKSGSDKNSQSMGQLKVVVKYKKLAIINTKPDTTKKSHEQIGRPF